MTCIQLSDLPLPVSDRQGWPWTEGPSGTPEVASGEQDWPRITVVTPSYNQDSFLEQTIRSVLLQGYPNLEYIVMDGGSTDKSVEIIRKYAKFLSYWVSKKDGGPEFAINEGWRRASGDYVSFLPSDDFYEPGALLNSAEALLQNPTASFVYSACKIRDANDNVMLFHDPAGQFQFSNLLKDYYFFAPTVLIRKSTLLISGLMNTSLRFISDWDLWFRLALCAPPVYAPHCAANAHSWEGSKTGSNTTTLKTSYIPCERALVLEDLLRKKAFPAAMAYEVRQSIAYHYGNWMKELTRCGQWSSLPRAYLGVIRNNPAFGLRILYRGIVNASRKALRGLRMMVPSRIKKAAKSWGSPLSKTD
jgi:glycosyltransferase involved in cell wall biosynthesis